MKYSSQTTIPITAVINVNLCVINYIIFILQHGPIQIQHGLYWQYIIIYFTDYAVYGIGLKVVN